MEETYLHNFIYIKGGAYTDVKKALRQWVFLYVENLPHEFEFKLYKKGRAEHAIRADGRLSNTMFTFLVNYLRYPEHNPNFKGKVMGYMRLGNWGLELPDQLSGLMAQVYAAENDSKHDEAYITTSTNETLCYSFTGKVSAIADEPNVIDYDVPEVHIEQLQKPYIVNVKKELDQKNKASNRHESAPEKRLRIGLLIFTMLLAISWAFSYNPEYFLQAIVFLSIFTTAALFMDYQLLQKGKIYTTLVLLGIAYAGYGHFLSTLYIESTISENAYITSLPMLFLLVQNPVRFLFKLLVKREPVIDKPPPSVLDAVYMIVLWMSTIAIVILANSLFITLKL